MVMELVNVHGCDLKTELNRMISFDSVKYEKFEELLKFGYNNGILDQEVLDKKL